MNLPAVVIMLASLVISLTITPSLWWVFFSLGFIPGVIVRNRVCGVLKR